MKCALGLSNEAEIDFVFTCMYSGASFYTQLFRRERQQPAKAGGAVFHRKWQKSTSATVVYLLNIFTALQKYS